MSGHMNDDATNVLVSAASRHGATVEIADTIAATLRECGLETEVHPPEEVQNVARYDAVVLGSALYAGRWLRPARELLDRSSDRFADRMVWLFSSGPVGDPPRAEDDPVDLAQMLETTRALEHRTFAGCLTRKKLTIPEKVLAMAFRVPDGDYRDWTAIQSWAHSIAASVAAGIPQSSATGENDELDRLWPEVPRRQGT
jgi:menaquinone-dependent protoporphyrinogen oxidase